MKRKISKLFSLVLSAALCLSVLNTGTRYTFAAENINEVYLSDLNWTDVQVNSGDSWAQPKKDRNSGNEPIRMIGSSGNAIPYAKGLGLHANCSVTYALNGNYTVFRADVGTDYINKEKNTSTSIQCSVYVDNETTPRWATSSTIVNNTPLQSIEVNVAGANTLKLVVNDAGDGVDSDWSIWGNARLERKALTPRQKLDEAIAEADKLLEENYTAETWQPFITALNNAKAVIGNEQQACTQAFTVLKEKQAALISRLKARYLSDIPWKSANRTSNKLPIVDSNFNYKPINVYGTEYDKGLGTHAGHEIVYQLNGQYQKFTAIVAPDNGCNADESKNMSIMGLVVYADGREIFRDDHINFHRQEQIPLDLNLAGVNELKICVTNGDNGNEWSDDLNLADAKLYYLVSELAAIKVNGKELQSFLPSVHSYQMTVEGNLPVVTAETLGRTQAVITQATATSNIATVQVGTQTYTIHFNDCAKFQSFGVNLPTSQLLEGTGIIHAHDIYVTVPDDMDRSAIAPVFTAGKWSTVTVNGVVQQSGVSVQNFTSPVVYRVTDQNGSTDYTVHIGTWRDIPKQFADENAGVMERPSVVNYPGTLTMKMFLLCPVKGSKTESNVSARFDYALNIIKQIDNVTRGVPKVIYLVGWQYQGHDDKYPAWFEVNDHLKCTSCNHATSLDCLKWLMDEAYAKYNTKVSLHINSTDSYKDSPLWQTYVDNDLISKTVLGTLKVIGTWEGETSYQINYKNEFEKGFYKQRVDRLIKMFDGRLQRAGTIHSDAFFCRSSKQSSVREEQEARVRMMRYWRDCGIDVTTEFFHDGNEKNAGGDGSGLLGVCPMTYHFNQSIDSYMARPASMVTGGGIADIKYGEDAETVEILFGRTMHGESLLTQREIYGMEHRPNWDVEFRNEFCTMTLPWTYQNTFKRLKLENNVVFYSDGLVANANNRTIRRDNRLIRENDDVFVPVTWKNNEVIAYSATGYSNKTWRFQKEFKANAVDIYTVGKNGLTKIASNVDVSNGKITLSLSAGQMVSIVPSNNN